MMSPRRLMAFRLPEASPFPKLCHCQPAHPAVNRYLKTTLSIAHSAVRRWMVHVERRILQNRKSDLPKNGRAQSPSLLRQPTCRLPGLLQSRQVRRQYPRHVLHPVRKPGSMKMILLESEILRRLNPRSRRWKNRTSHVCTRSSVPCANRRDLCQNLPSENLFAASMPSA